MLSSEDRAAWNRWVGLSRRMEGDERLPTARIVVAVDKHIRALEAVAKTAGVIASNAMLAPHDQWQKGLCLINRRELEEMRDALAALDKQEGKGDGAD